MVKQPNQSGNGQIIPTAVHLEMERSYLEYAMSVIIGRALPDVRDGLKPVHRRILFAMYELGLTPDRPFRKCARVVGDVLGKYHPHGDQSVYDALVRLVQDFSTRYPLLGGHGNFGSVDDDPPAAMRYTETRLSPVGYQAMLNGISESIVDFTSNFDNSQEEPVVLPAQLPILLLNGCSGIAVGMATNIPPHNLGEVVEGLIALIDNPQLEDEKLWELIPGPDFPTGGIIDKSGIKEAYRTGRGSITMRGVTEVEQIESSKKRGRDKTALIVTELPYQVAKAAWIEKVAELVNHGKIEGIGDLRDESDRTGMRVVIELKKDSEPENVLAQLYHQTALESNFGVIMLALVDKKPIQLSLRQLLQEFLTFREETLRRLYSNELNDSQQRLHILEGLLTALGDLDRVIDILRNSADGTTAKVAFTQQLSLSESQADSILAMPLRRLTGLEQEKILNEYGELQTKIAQLEKLLSDRHELLKGLKRELRSLKRQFADERRTRIVEALQKPHPETTPPVTPPETSTSIPENATVEISHQGSISWLQSPSTNKFKATDDFLVQQTQVNPEDSLVVVTTSAKAYPLPVSEIPPGTKKVKKSLLSLLPGGNKESEVLVAHFLPQQDDLILLSAKARIKRLPISELEGLGNRGFTLLKLKDEDVLKYVCRTNDKKELAIATSRGRVLRCGLNDKELVPLGKTAMGNLAFTLTAEETLVGCESVKPEEHLLLVTELGYTKRILVKSLRFCLIGDVGNFMMQFSSKSDRLAAMILPQTPTVVLITDSKRKIPLVVETVKSVGKDGSGDRLVTLKPDEKIISVLNCY